jgi:serine/threonine-protein kinase
MFITGLAVLPDYVGLIIGTSLFGGVHTISVGVVGCVFTQALLLSRSHVARQRELERAAEELRRQVVERSRELSVALAELAKRPPEPLGEDRVIADRYRIVRRLGAGGMGTVYEVARTSDGRRLALKTLRGRTDPEVMQRFAREAEIAAELDHENLVPVLDVGIADGSLYLVMPLVEGGSLEQQRPRFGDAAFARPILAQIAAGLAALHARGIVHRDLKPGNVLLAPNARIADFGLAAFDPTSSLLGTLASGSLELADTAHPGALPPGTPHPGALPPGTPGTPTPPLTRAGDIFGTPRYMAPELAAGAGDASPAADVFAFGVMAFEMLAGRQPFVEPVVMARLENREPAPPSVDALPDDLRPLVARCLAFDPAVRPSAADLAAAFRPR